MLYSYKMTHDTGFAPNPFFGILSLATCKPSLRKSKKIGDYVAGFTSKTLCGEKEGEEKLVFIMKVSNEMSYSQYFNNKEFECKKASRINKITMSGDNIYYKENDNYNQAFTYFHRDKKSQQQDLKSEIVLLSDDFFYFGSAALSIDQFRINIPRTQSAYGVKTTDKEKISKLWLYLTSTFKKNCLIGPPHDWREGEEFNIEKNGCY